MTIVGLVKALGVHSLSDHLTQCEILPIALLRSSCVLPGLVLLTLLSIRCLAILRALEDGTSSGRPTAIG